MTNHQKLRQLGLSMQVIDSVSAEAQLILWASDEINRLKNKLLLIAPESLVYAGTVGKWIDA